MRIAIDDRALMKKVECSTVDWVTIRRELIASDGDASDGFSDFRWQLGDEVFEMIVDGRTEQLSERLRREISLLLRGYWLAQLSRPRR